jgi:hypothetical protein
MSDEAKIYHLPSTRIDEETPVHAAARALANDSLVQLNYSPERGTDVRKILNSRVVGSLVLDRVGAKHPVIYYQYDEVLNLSERIMREES